MKITKREHAFKGFASTNFELQLKDTESVITSNRFINSIKGF